EHGESHEQEQRRLRVFSHGVAVEKHAEEQVQEDGKSQERSREGRRAEHTQALVFSFHPIGAQEAPRGHGIRFHFATSSWVSSVNASASPARCTSKSCKSSSAASKRRTTFSALLAVMCNPSRSPLTLCTSGQDSISS